jgi:two-component system alkaline phosphatase synthesis response regulator PhoP
MDEEVNKPDFKHTILVVDDDPDLLELLSLSFKAAGFSVVIAADGAEALKRARSMPDLIVLDLVLPVVDGFTVCRNLKADRATAAIPILMITGLSSELNRFEGLECGANGYISKPFAPDELIAKMKILLGGSAGSPPTRSAD